MAMNPQDKTQLTQFTNAAKAIIFDAQRMQKFMQMLGSKQGALIAVQTVMGAIEKNRPIPPMIAPLLGVNIYMIMVDFAQDATGIKADGKIMREVIASILSTAIKSHGKSQPPKAPAPQQPVQQPAPQPQPAMPAGLINQGA